MNFNGFSFDDGTRSLLEELDRASRVPHAVIIESPDAEKAMQAAAAGAVLTADALNGYPPISGLIFFV